MKYPKEEQFWQQFLAGDRQAFSELFLKFRPLLLHYGMKLCQNREQAEECIQDLFCYLFENKENLTHIRRIKPYLFVVFRRQLLNQQQSGKKLLSVDGVLSELAVQFSQEEIMIDHEIQSLEQQKLWKMLNALPVRQREVVYLKYYQGLNTDEIATSMDITHQGVLNALYKAFKKLRKTFKATFKSSFYFFFCL